ncbi:MAG: Rrf2 family transcriptional regulator [Gemmatimonadota bacterium]
MWLGSTAQHAVRAVLYITEHGTDAPVRVDEIAAALAAARNYLSKTLHQLVRAGVLRSVRGPNGGFQLVDAPSALSVARIVAPFLPSQQTRCLMGRPNCGGANPCAAHHRWRRVADGVVAFFEQTSAAQLLADNGTPRTARKTARPRQGPASMKRPATKRPVTKRPATKHRAARRPT